MELISGSKQEWRVSGGSGGERRVSGGSGGEGEW